MKQFYTLLLAGSILAVAGAASATPTISIGLQESGVLGGAITTEASGGSPQLGNFAYGDFSINLITANGTGAPGSLDSSSLNVAGDNNAATLYVYVTLQGVTSPTGSASYFSSLTANTLPAGWTLTESTYGDSGNGVYTKTSALASNIFSSIGTYSSTNSFNAGAGPYSITEVYAITMNAGSAGSTANDTIDMNAVPEPASLGLLGMGLMGLGFIRRRFRA